MQELIEFFSETDILSITFDTLLMVFLSSMVYVPYLSDRNLFFISIAT